ncbi:serine/threonine-protein kinase [Dyella sp. GSA-30]|uniref:serine/threonine-protein kinase n=1 Tax=Dyella sp. GSA-30 TaxID=2994496 RepID=UPI00248F53FC|nr:serine/threonine-protein kinase [Dyella sp. GSA-30]
MEQLFNAAITQPPDRWSHFLETNETDATVRAAVLRMLEHAHNDDPHPVQAQLQRIGSSLAAMPDRIGPYRLLRQIGEGGMGSVFLAERDVDGAFQQVALKLLHGLPTAAGKRRMARERELLAGMNHPHIAGLIDSGEAASGQPFLVMDYVEGHALADFLASRQLTLRDRVRLCAQCCDAIQHAHQHLVLHRDVKPSNIVVSNDGTPVLLDFGIGTLLEASPSGVHTATLAFTPGYAAPEQIRGYAATTATDIFGLGALLFDVLTGLRLPDLRKGDMPVPLPSSQPIAPSRRRELRGDLDRIVMKATALAPEDRYRTAAALSDDLHRYLRGEPVLAAPDSLFYRLRKLVNRHRWAAAASVAIVCVIVAFVVRLDIERQRALQAEAAAVREAGNANASREFLVSVLAASDPEAGRGRPMTVSALLTSATSQLRNERMQDEGTRALVWLAVAEIYKNINDPVPGLQAIDTAADLFKRTNQTDPDLQARVLETRGVLLGQLERIADAKRTLQDLIALRSGPNTDMLALARAHQAYATVAALGGDREQAERSLDHALTLLKAGSGPTDRLRLDLLLDRMNLHASRPGDSQAAPYLTQVLKLATATLEADDPKWRTVHQTASTVYRGLGQYPQALPHAESALAIAQRVYGNSSQYTMDQESELAMVLGQLGRYRDAVTHMERARSLHQALGLDDLVLAQQDILLAWLYEGRGDSRRAIALLDSTLARLPQGDPTYITWRWVAYKQRASAHGDLRQFEQAWADVDEALRWVREDRGGDSIEYSQIQARYAQLLLDAGRLSQAEVALATAKRLSQARSAGPYTAIWIRLAELDAQLAQAKGQISLARQRMDEALALAEKERNSDPIKIAKVKLLAADLAFRQHDADRARSLLREAMPVLEQEMSSQSPQLAKARWLAKKTSQ